MKKIKLIIILFAVIVVFGCLYLKNNVLISETSYAFNSNFDDVIGYINIKSINLTRVLVQGYDNTYYLNHNYFREDSENGEFFLDFEGDLLNNKNAYIYTNIGNLDYDSLNIKDVIEIGYFNNNYCYEVTSDKNKSDLIIKIYDNNLSINVLCKKIMC